MLRDHVSWSIQNGEMSTEELEIVAEEAAIIDGILLTVLHR